MKTGAAICIRPNCRGGECVGPSMTSSGPPPPPMSPPETNATRMLPARISRRAKNPRGHNWRRFYAREDRKTGLRVWLSFFIYLYSLFYVRRAFAAYAARCSPRDASRHETVMRFARNSKAKIILGFEFVLYFIE